MVLIVVLFLRAWVEVVIRWMGLYVSVALSPFSSVWSPRFGLLID